MSAGRQNPTLFGHYARRISTVSLLHWKQLYLCLASLPYRPIHRPHDVCSWTRGWARCAVENTFQSYLVPTSRRTTEVVEGLYRYYRVEHSSAEILCGFAVWLSPSVTDKTAMVMCQYWSRQSFQSIKKFQAMRWRPRWLVFLSGLHADWLCFTWCTRLLTLPRWEFCLVRTERRLNLWTVSAWQISTRCEWRCVKPSWGPSPFFSITDRNWISYFA